MSLADGEGWEGNEKNEWDDLRGFVAMRRSSSSSVDEHRVARLVVKERVVADEEEEDGARDACFWLAYCDRYPLQAPEHPGARH